MEFWTPLIFWRPWRRSLNWRYQSNYPKHNIEYQQVHQTVPCRAYYPDMYNGGEHIGAEILGQRKVFDNTDRTRLINVLQGGTQLKSSYVFNEDPKDITTYPLGFFTDQEPSPVFVCLLIQVHISTLANPNQVTYNGCPARRRQRRRQDRLRPHRPTRRRARLPQPGHQGRGPDAHQRRLVGLRRHCERRGRHA